MDLFRELPSGGRRPNGWDSYSDERLKYLAYYTREYPDLYSLLSEFEDDVGDIGGAVVVGVLGVEAPRGDPGVERALLFQHLADGFRRVTDVFHQLVALFLRAFLWARRNDQYSDA